MNNSNNNKRKYTAFDACQALAAEDWDALVAAERAWERRMCLEALVISFEFRYPIQVLAKQGKIPQADADRCCAGIREIAEKEIRYIKLLSFAQRAHILRRKKRLERLVKRKRVSL